MLYLGYLYSAMFYGIIFLVEGLGGGRELDRQEQIFSSAKENCVGNAVDYLQTTY